ncbi:thioredoxin family protein [Rhizobium leguminosarum]|uniref:thioredoxin family protein n=1 Tax=Rhizobium leguminosarum TaxID=384 RepID=UPI00098FAA7A|nr:thioredoxin family protein [Rhizobium leguminosarum]MBB5256022.1 thioredoxin-like negative regulator of GroEL [Rhizobium leguminosarum]MDX6001337.1 thioredoxin family protein [Rhizobium leguminosarum]OOO44013.1 thiol reductase thioredoxin [Rhizobium leguminosarum bv. viciae USDA 2370]PUB63251.1 thiol reductase thioredoxin [Rhizobium leguminosarum bv. viciae USDA 2370]
MNRRQFLASTSAALLTAGLASNSASAAEFIPGFDDAAARGVPVLVHVTAPWCEVCQAQKPVVARLLGTGDFKSMKKFDVDFDSQKSVLRKLKVQSQSTMVLFKDGKEIDRSVGVSDPARIEAFLRKAL